MENSKHIIKDSYEVVASELTHYTSDQIDFNHMPPKPNYKDYHIWLGWYHLGQGHDSPTKPEKIATIKATSFKIACVIYEHQSSIDSLNMQMDRGDTYIEDCHFGQWYYDPETNGNSWTGKYYETYEEALKSFK